VSGDEITEITQHRLEVPRTARFHLRAGDAGPPREVWFVLHGYGQLAGAFLQGLDALARPTRLLVAPEALSRYYLKRGTGTVGASWMTREERADEIRDTVRYLDLLWEHVRATHALAPTVALAAFGFSQGGAAAARWAVLGRSTVARAVSFACPLPADLDLDAHAARVRALRWSFALGDGDASIDREAFAAGRVRLRAAGAESELRTFAGGHELDPAILAALEA
jgi:predicted esterase